MLWRNALVAIVATISPLRLWIKSIGRDVSLTSVIICKSVLNKVLEACVKNCGSPIHDEIASKFFLDDIRLHVKVTTQLLLIGCTHKKKAKIM